MAATSKSVPKSDNGDINALLSGSEWNTGNLTFSFPTSASFYNYSGQSYDESAHSFQTFTPPLQDAALKAFAIFSQYANVTFTKITETGSTHADIRLALANPLQLDATGTGYFPSDGPKNGDLWLTASKLQPDPGGEFTQSGLDLGGGGFLDLMHEIGHTLGFSHPGTSIDPTHYGWDFTIMSYQSFPDGPILPPGDHPETPMLADVAALQYMYGANFNTNAGDTTYKWSPTTGEMFINGVAQGVPGVNKIYMTLWDGGGNDTYDFSNYTTNVTADLRPGEWSTPAFDANNIFGSHNQLPNIGSYTDAAGKLHEVFAEGSIANAYLYNGDTRSLIENAIGGSGNDTLIGNQGNNVLTGNGGDDTFFYTGGVDTFDGGVKGATGDTADFSLSSVGVDITPVVSTITLRLPNGQTSTVVVSDTSALADGSGNAYDASQFTDIGLIHLVDMHAIENITGSPFADTITGNLGNNIIKAGDGNDHVFYTGGFDTIEGGNGIDTIDFSNFGSAITVTLSLFIGVAEAYTTDTSSILTGTSLRAIADLAGFENVIGTAFADSLIGNSGNNTLNGDAGNDFLFYDGGLDVLNGNTGNDTADFSHMTSAVFVDLAGGGFEAKSNGTTKANTGNLVNIADLQSIENLNGTASNDVLRGDSNANVIDADSGDDTLVGRGGNDTLRGGPGNDTYDLLGTGQGSDVLFDDSGTDRIFIDNIANIIKASKDGNDLVVTSTNGSFRIVDHFNGHPIENLVDSTHGVVLATSSIGGGGSGIIAGTDGNETLDGRGGDDLLYGNGGNDLLLGGTGNDLLDGGPGNDTLSGGPGNDVFVFAADSENDVITDFSQGEDRIDLSAFHTSFSDLVSGKDDAPVALTVDGSDTVLVFAGGTVRIEGISGLQANDFLFVSQPNSTSILAVIDTQIASVDDHLVTIAVNLSDTATVTGNPTLLLNTNQPAGYTSGSGTDTLIFTYVVQPGDNVADLQVIGLGLSAGNKIQDMAGNDVAGNVTGDLAIAIDTTTVSATTVQQEIFGLYAALHNRATDFGGFSFWTGVVAGQPDGSGVTTANAGNTAVTVNDATVLGQLFINMQSSYFNATYGSLSDSAFITALYVNIGGNATDIADGVTYWTNLLQAAEAAGQSVQAARAGIVGQIVHDMIDFNVSKVAPGYTAAQWQGVVQRQATIDNKIAVSEALSNASQQPGGSILNAHSVGDDAFNASVAVMQGVTSDPTTVIAAVIGINNAVAHQDLTLI